MSLPAALHLEVATSLLWDILQSNRNADSVLRQGYAAHPRLGSRDRAAVSDAVFGGLRYLRSLGYRLAQPEVLPTTIAEVRERLALWLVDQGGWTLDKFASAWSSPSADTQNRLHHALSPAPVLPPAVQSDLPDWLYQPLQEELGEVAVAALADAFNKPASLDVRANRIEREALAAQLAQLGLTSTPTPWSPWGLRLSGRPSLAELPLYQQGLLEVQDEGSQLIAPLVAPRRGETVVDFCAGAGGKTLHLASLMADTGTLYACDPSDSRLSQLKQRVARAGLRRVQVVRSHDGQARALQGLQGKAQRVLVDAPCSGTGTLRRHPEIKWQRHDLSHLVAEQERIFEAAAALVRPGGCLVYATCSVLPVENQQVVAHFLAQHPEFRGEPAAPRLARYHAHPPLQGEDLRLWPHCHGTDGFYGAILTAKN